MPKKKNTIPPAETAPEAAKASGKASAKSGKSQKSNDAGQTAKNTKKAQNTQNTQNAQNTSGAKQTKPASSGKKSGSSKSGSSKSGGAKGGSGSSRKSGAKNVLLDNYDEIFDYLVPAEQKSGKKSRQSFDFYDEFVKEEQPADAAQKSAKATKTAKSGKGGAKKADAKKVRVIPLGGLGEIGKNMTAIEYENDMIVIDCGLGFPEEDMYGVDLVIPDFSYLEANRDKLRAVLLTHGHEDHIGAIPYLLRSFNVPVYGTALTICIIKNRLKEHKLSFEPQLNVVKAGAKIRFGVFEAEFIHVNHSVADACAIAVQTPVGTFLHTGDFKLDVSPIEGEMMDVRRLGELGRQGVQLLMCESTNAERAGFTPSERSVGSALENLFVSNADKRIVVATFSSNVHRVQQVIDISVRHGRHVAVSGRSMQNIVAAAIELGYMKPPAGTLIDIADIKNYAPGQITLVTTGSQGEPMSALYRMAFGDHRDVTLGKQDVVILSSSTIPGNEKTIGNIINELSRGGIKVIYDGVFFGVHASGHACAEEIKFMQALTKPKFYMPIHGECRHLEANRQIAHFMGIPEENVFVGEIGSVLEVGRNSAAWAEPVPSGRTLIDGYGIGDVGNAVLRDRKHLSEDGVVIVYASVDLPSRLVLTPPDIISKGFVYMPDSEELIYEAKLAAARELTETVEHNTRKKPDIETVKERVRREVAKVLSSQTGRNPIVIPIISEL